MATLGQGDDAGRAFGFVPPAVVGAAAFAAGVPDWGMLPILTVAGSLEGASIGFAQSTVLADELPELPQRRWIFATAAAAAGAWFIGMIPSALGSFTEEHLVMVAVAMSLLAPVLINSIGVAQWLVLRDYIAPARPWIPVNAAAWLAGIPLVFIAMAVVPDGAPIVARVMAAVAGAVAMGGVAAAITGRALVSLLDQKQEGESR